MQPLDFQEYYKKISNTELLDILNNADDYHLSAVEAARNELNSRGLSDEDLEVANEPLMLEQMKKDRKAMEKMELAKKIKEASNQIFYVVAPEDSKEKLADKKIVFIVICYAVYFILTITLQYNTIWGIILDITESPLLVPVYLLPLFATPVALVTFWRRKSAGWSMLALIVSFNATINFSMLYKRIVERISRLYIDNLYGSPVRGADIFYLFILTSTLIVLCRTDMRRIYNIGTPKMAGLVFIGMIIGLLFIY